MIILFNKILRFFTPKKKIQTKTRRYKGSEIIKDEYESKFDIYGFNKEGYDKYGFDREGYNKYGFNRSGIDREGYDILGFNKNGYNRSGFNKEGFDRVGYNIDGYNRRGFNRKGFNREGYNEFGYNIKGIHKSGKNIGKEIKSYNFNKGPIHKITYTGTLLKTKNSNPRFISKYLVDPVENQVENYVFQYCINNSIKTKKWTANEMELIYDLAWELNECHTLLLSNQADLALRSLRLTTELFLKHLLNSKNIDIKNPFSQVTQLVSLNLLNTEMTNIIEKIRLLGNNSVHVGKTKRTVNHQEVKLLYDKLKSYVNDYIRIL